jgi:hypothetical protein
MRERICVLAWKEPGISGVSRGEKLHVCGEAQFMADELNREWPSMLRQPMLNWQLTLARPRA